jgi:ligand-binding sensor domain-containing protein/signal transduction histidine kinase
VLLGGVLAMLVPSSGVAGPGALASDDYHPTFTRFRRLSPEHGLSQVSALAIAQDRHGFVWIGTQDGLNRFDGYEFRHFHATPGAARATSGVADAGVPVASLPDDRVNALVVDHAGVLWAGTRGGLVRYHEDADRFVHVSAQATEAARTAEQDIHALLVDRAGRLWAGSHGGLLVLDRERGVLQRLPALPDLRIESLAEGADGAIWVGTLGGLFRFDPDTQRHDQPWLGSAAADTGLRGRIDALAVDVDGALWIGAVGNGLYRFEVDGKTLQRFRHDRADPHSIASDHVRSLLFDRAGRLWIGSREGLDLATARGADELRVSRFSHARHDAGSLGNGRVMSLFEDRSGALWIGTYNGGISLLSPRGNRFAAFGPDRAATAQMRDAVVHSLGRADDGALLIGSRNGLYSFLPGEGRLREIPSDQRLAVGSIAVDGEGLWLGGSVGLAMLGADGRVAPIAGLPPVVASARVTAVKLDDGLVWVGTYDRGLHVLSRQTLQALSSFPTRSWISTIDRFSDDLVLASGSDGLHWFDRSGKHRVFTHASGTVADSVLPPGGITSFLRDRVGRMWLSSAGGGLIRMQFERPDDPESARFSTFHGSQPLASNVVHAMLEDRDGRLWLATSRGISTIDPGSGEVLNFTSADGAFDSDYSSAAAVSLEDGTLAFGASEGFLLVSPVRLRQVTDTPAPLLTELRLWNRPVLPSADAGSLLQRPLHLSTSSALTLPAAQARMLGLRFAAPDFVAAQRLRYAYRLDGFDEDWIDTPASERSATYTNLAPGDYLFRVRSGETAEALAGGPEASLAIRILPPWWQTWWARAGALLLLVAGLLSLHGLRLRGAVQQRQALEQEVAERTSELSQAKEAAESALLQLKGAQRQLVESEKMASLGQLVAGISHEINTPIGIAVTAASHLHDCRGEVSAKLESGRLTRSELTAWNRTIEEAMRLILGSLERAHALIGSFKQVAVDQTSERRRRFDLAGFLTEVQFSLQPSYRIGGHSLEIDCAGGIELDTYPGALFRIITNWTSNSLTHGFGERRNGRMSVQVREDGDWVELHYRDDGAGMAQDVAHRAFDPFFTTRRGSGGSGLGLHLVYNLATRLLGGSISLHSTPGVGTRFVLRIPKLAPARSREAVESLVAGIDA